MLKLHTTISENKNVQLLSKNMIASLGKWANELDVIKFNTIGSDNFLKGDHAWICRVRLNLIYEQLEFYDKVCFIGSDFVFLKTEIFDIVDDLLNRYDLVTMCDLPSKYFASSCFMAISRRARHLFQSRLLLPSVTARFHDQEYTTHLCKNNICSHLILPLETCPDGHFWMNYRDRVVDPYFVHFNHIKGLENKIKRIKEDGMWYLNDLGMSTKDFEATGYDKIKTPFELL